MKLKPKHSLSLLALAIYAAASTCALAQTGTITINGEIIADSCTANIESSGGSGNASNFTVNLDPVSYGIFNAANVVAGEKAFTIKLTGCTTSAGTTSMWAHFTGANVEGDGRLKTSHAKMAFELTDGFGGSAIKAGGSAASGGPGADQGSGATFTGNNPDRAASKEYAVRYSSKDALVVGDAATLSSSVTYNIQYF